MKSSFCVAAFAVWAVLTPGVVAQESGMVALEALGSALRGSPAWQADYRQEYVAAGMTAGETAAGVVVAAWPDRALFRTVDPQTQVMGLDGRLVRLVDLTIPSCDEHMLSDDEWGRIPLAAVLDPRGAIDRFSVLEHGSRGFILIPHEPGGVDRVELSLGEDDLPAEVVVVDPQGATNRLHFTAWRPTDGPPDGSWLPQPPPGLECVSDENSGF
jgi:outer membrane lipoprotein-sorting protein